MGSDSKLPAIIDLENPSSWPPDLVAHLERHLELLVTWENPGRTGDPFVLAQKFDHAIRGVSDILRRYALAGWHCTKLTETEIETITAHGMTPPNGQFLEARIAALETAGIIPADIGMRLRTKHQANDENRAGRIWFCFFPPRIAEESGIERFFRSWGGEALYNFHEDDPQTGPVLTRIGIPCLVEAEVPVASFRGPDALALKIYRIFLVSRGNTIRGRVEHEDRAVDPLPATAIRRIIRYPEPDFIRLTKCDEWRKPLT